MIVLKGVIMNLLIRVRVWLADLIYPGDRGSCRRCKDGKKGSFRDSAAGMAYDKWLDLL